MPADVLYAAVMTSDGAAGWSQSVKPFQLPPGLVLVLGDVCGGSSSSSMVCLGAEFSEVLVIN